MPDEHQQKVVEDLQKLYEHLKNYEPKSPTVGISKWFSFGEKKATEPDLKGLYIYGSVGGGKTMLMDMFYDCCEVFDLESIFVLSIYFTFPVSSVDREEKARSLQFIHDGCS